MMKYVLIAVVFIIAGVFIWQKQQAQQQPNNNHVTQSDITQTDKPDRSQSSKIEQKTQTAEQATVSPAFYQAREKILANLNAARTCQQSGSCQADVQDPKAAMFEQEQRLVDSLQALQDLYNEHQHEDAVLAQTINEFVTSPLGRVQFKAVQMMQQQSPNVSNAHSLLEALDNSFDSKVMALALQELIRYPSLSEQIDALLMSNLQTGSFYASRTIAKEITPFLNAGNLEQYQALANELPPNSAKTKLLQSAINEYRQN